MSKTCSPLDDAETGGSKPVGPNLIQNIASDAYFIPETTLLFDQLQAFRTRREHFAVVVDEYGDFRGIVTLEDILEEIVGDIDDEHDILLAGLTAQADGSWVVDGNVTIRDLNRALAGVCLMKMPHHWPALCCMKAAQSPARPRISFS